MSTSFQPEFSPQKRVFFSVGRRQFGQVLLATLCLYLNAENTFAQASQSSPAAQASLSINRLSTGRLASEPQSSDHQSSTGQLKVNNDETAPAHALGTQLATQNILQVLSDGPIDYSLPDEKPDLASYIWPIADVLAINLSMWGSSKIAGATFADVTPEMWAENFQTGFQWDDNEFEVNQVGHPYQGGLYFASARVNGLSYWESIPYTMFGSFQWEFFMETEQPSTNDWMTTTWGGVFFGEMLHRLSNRVLDDSTSGSTRFWKEFSALAISPVNGIDRLLSGAAWQDGPAGKQFPLAANLRVGPDGIGLSEGTGWGKTIRAKIRFDYGDPYAKDELDIPFEVFDFAAQINLGKDILGQGFDGTGVLLGSRFRGTHNSHLLAWVLDFEYFTNGTTKLLTRESAGVYQLGEMGTGIGWYGQWRLPAGFSVNTRADGLFVPTGAITSPWVKFEANRSYSYGVGAATKLEMDLRHERWGKLYARANRYLYGIVDGPKGTEHVGLLQLGAYFNAYQGHGLGGSVILYDRESYYSLYPDFQDSFWTGQVQYEVEY